MENENNENLDINNGAQIETEVQKPVSKWKKGWRKEIIDWVEAIVIAVVVALFLRHFVLTLALVSGESMETTLSDGDRLYVNKLFYTPQKGDVVIVESEKHVDENGKILPLVKRVIATEGDTIYIDPLTNDVYVNDKLLEEDYIKGRTVINGAAYGAEGKIIACDDRVDKKVAAEYMRDDYSRENPIVIGKDECFVMGDNRENSSDSRNFGTFKYDEVVGHALFRFWPISDALGL